MARLFCVGGHSFLGLDNFVWRALAAKKSSCLMKPTGPDQRTALGGIDLQKGNHPTATVFPIGLLVAFSWR
jgi:hypothetical protein